MKKKADKFSLKDQSTADTVTPPQISGKTPFQVPVSSKDSIDNKSANKDNHKMQPNEMIEYYNVMYTKHITQKSKTWEDGFLEHHMKNNKVRGHF